MEILLAPPLAFIIYLLAAGGLALFGKKLAGRPQAAADARPSPLKTSLYASGNAPREQAAPGYRSFFVIALFFAALHLGALVLGTLVLGSGSPSATAALYVVGLAITLIALLLG